MKFQLQGNYYNGEFHLGETGGLNKAPRVLENYSPADTELLLTRIPVVPSDVEKVLESANNAFSSWKSLSFQQRAQYLLRYQEVVGSKKEEIAQAISWEMGKPFWEAKTEASALAAKVTVTLNESLKRIETKSYPEISPATQGKHRYKPLGVSLVIGPFNFPCHLANGQILSALIAGNPVIFKPSEKTPYSADLMMRCFHEAGFPKGVINMIQGDGQIAGRLLKERDVKGVFFTGSKEVGLKILESTYKDLSKLVSLELGGKNTSLIHKDARMDLVLEETLKACYLTTGQRCTSTGLIAIHEELIDEYTEKFHALSKKIIVDHPIEHDIAPFMGPLVDERATENYLQFMSMAKREGIDEVMRGKRLDRARPGYYVSPSIHRASKFNRDSHFLQSEIFAPNVTLIPYKEIEEAIEIANSTEYGLAASIFTQDDSLYEKAAQSIDVGIFNYNRSTVGATAKLPFGGVKSSGNYRPAALTTIDACVYSQANLECPDAPAAGIGSITGLM